MKRFLPLMFLPLLAACNPAIMANLPPLPGMEEPEPPAPPVLPPAAAAALPPGTPPSVVLTDAEGCYLYSIEVTDPPSGFPLRDQFGNRVCEGGNRPDPVIAPAPVLPAA